MLIQLIKFAAILIAAILTGNWFLSEVRKAKALKKPWYAPYVSLPGLLIIIIIFIPVLMRIFI